VGDGLFWSSPILLAQGEVLSPPPGAYLSWYKLLMIATAYLVWVKTSDWVNRSSLRFGRELEMPPEIWNPILTGSFLVGLLLVLFVPIFAVGFTLFVLSTTVPFVIFFILRRSKLAKRPDLVQQIKSKSGGPPPPPPLPQDEGAPMEFSPSGRDKQHRQMNLIRARQTPEFPALKNLLADLFFKRSEMAMFDYSRVGVAGRFQVDGVWHPLPAMDRATGDAMLMILKYLAGLNPEDRRSKQTGSFLVKTPEEKMELDLLTQGTPGGERAQLKVVRQRKAPLTLVQQGMFPEMVEQMKKTMLTPCITVVTAPKGEGLTLAWQGALMNSERFVRDCVAIEAEGATECVVENIVLKHYNSPANQVEVTKTALLTQPDFIAVPEVESDEMMEILLLQVRDQQRSLLLRTTANSAAEGLVTMLQRIPKSHRDAFIHHVKLVTGQKLIRRLCPDCRQETRVTSETIQKLGGNPKQQTTIYQEYRLPPPEQRVDAKGRPIEIPPCPICGGLSYLGRIAAIEFLVVDDEIRNLIAKKPNASEIEALAQKLGKLSIQKQAHKLVLLGVTTIAEVQRVFKK
jgi:type II secretory ATPase GspE/PulE/Tfp pilus assembly ATPase PilB-like protein